MAELLVRVKQTIVSLEMGLLAPSKTPSPQVLISLWRLRLAEDTPSFGWRFKSEADGGAALARIRSADEDAGFGVDHDGMGAAEGFRIAGDNLVASALQFLNCRFGNTRFQANL